MLQLAVQNAIYMIGVEIRADPMDIGFGWRNRLAVQALGKLEIRSLQATALKFLRPDGKTV